MLLDALEPLLQRNTDILQPTDYNYTISFIGTAISMSREVVESIRSINRIGEELGRDFELVVVHGPDSGEYHGIMRELRKEYPNLIFLESHITSIGQGKKIAFDYTTGKFIVPFDTSIVYPIKYSDVLHNFLKFKLKRLYYSELPLISRYIIEEVGGWRNLSSGEDIDLYSRLAINYGVFACPTNLLAGDDVRKRQLISIRAFPDSSSYDFKSKYQLIKDMIISCNHSFSDVRSIGKIISEEGGSGRYMLSLSYIGSRFSNVKPISYNRNNYVIFMEAILESLILREYLKMPDVKEEVSWHIDKAHRNFLKIKSKLFKEMKDSTTFFIKKED